MEHGELGSFLLAFAAALFGGKLLGELCERIGQPAVLGELLAGVLLGPSLLGLVPLSAGILLLAEIGVILLLFEVGLETDLGELVRVGGPAMMVALVGMVLPFLGGYLLTRIAGFSALTAIFVGAALTATSIGITSRVLSELGMLSSREGQIILGAAVADDILGLVVLAVVSQIAATGSVSMWQAGKAAILSFAFLLVALVIGMPLGRVLIRVVKRASVRGILVAASVAFALLAALGAQTAGSAAIVGAFAAGLVLARTDRSSEIYTAVRPIVDVFAPVFFVSIGAQVNLQYLNPTVSENRQALLLALGLIVVGVLGKFAAGFASWGRVRRTFVGAGMIPRGEVGLIFAQIGKQNGALPEPVFIAVVIAVFATTFVTPPLLKALRPRTPIPGT
ncbi:MAG TPA: cation:proton antiporter [Thermoanaerobaculia bacterium]|nr:cation:proton antiporter [Thermoanaerobaculia bacterium]